VHLYSVPCRIHEPFFIFLNVIIFVMFCFPQLNNIKVFQLEMMSNHAQTKNYRVIRKSLQDFRLLGYSSVDGHAEGEHVNRERDTPIFCSTLQVLYMSNLGDAADVNPVIKFLPRTVNHVV
jgi:hypothetical protein